MWNDQTDTPVKHAPEVCPHTLFTYKTKSGGNDGIDEESEEPLHIHAFYDTSVLEVFVNERTVLSTRIYYATAFGDSTSTGCHGMYFFAEESDVENNEFGTTGLLGAMVWDGLAA